jgi:hypothetical protein
METGRDADGEPDPERDTAVAATTMGRAMTDPFPGRFLERLTDAGDRMGGYPGERRAVELVSSALADAGAEPRELSFPITRWTRGEAELVGSASADTDDPGRSFEAVGLPYTPSGDVRAPLVDAGQGTPEELDDVDVSGGIVLARQGSAGERHVHRMEKYGHAVAAGAEAFVLVNDTPGGLPVTGTLRFGEPGAVPAVGVSHEAGGRLARYAGGGGAGRLRSRPRSTRRTHTTSSASSVRKPTTASSCSRIWTPTTSARGRSTTAAGWRSPSRPPGCSPTAPSIAVSSSPASPARRRGCSGAGRSRTRSTSTACVP